MEVLGSKFTTSISNAFDNFGEKLKSFFIPTFDPVKDLWAEFSSRFGFVEQCFTVVKGLFTDISDEAPVFAFNYKDSTYNIIDFSVFEPYRPLLFMIQYTIYTYRFSDWTIKNIPSILEGLGK